MKTLELLHDRQLDQIRIGLKVHAKNLRKLGDDAANNGHPHDGEMYRGEAYAINADGGDDADGALVNRLRVGANQIEDAEFEWCQHAAQLYEKRVKSALGRAEGTANTVAIDALNIELAAVRERLKPLVGLDGQFPGLEGEETDEE